LLRLGERLIQNGQNNGHLKMDNFICFGAVVVSKVGISIAESQRKIYPTEVGNRALYAQQTFAVSLYVLFILFLFLLFI
jgi:hypothetical protein